MKVYITFVKWIKGDTVSLMDPNATACVQFIYSSLNHSFPLFLHFKMRCFFSLEIQMQINDVHLSSFWKKKEKHFSFQSRILKKLTYIFKWRSLDYIF